MLDFIPEFQAWPIIAEREREAIAIARVAVLSRGSSGVKARIAACLARLAVALHRDAAARAGLPQGAEKL